MFVIVRPAEICLNKCEPQIDFKTKNSETQTLLWFFIEKKPECMTDDCVVYLSVVLMVLTQWIWITLHILVG